MFWSILVILKFKKGNSGSLKKCLLAAELVSIVAVCVSTCVELICYDKVCVFEEAAILESHGIEVQSPGGQSNSDEVDGNDFPDQVSQVCSTRAQALSVFSSCTRLMNVFHFNVTWDPFVCALRVVRCLSLTRELQPGSLLSVGLTCLLQPRYTPNYVLTRKENKFQIGMQVMG